MNNMTCDWCLEEAAVQKIDDKLWRFWKTISDEDPITASHKNICRICKSRYQGFSMYIERCKSNASIINQVTVEPSIDIEYHPFIKEEVLEEEQSSSGHTTNLEVPLIDDEDPLLIENGDWKELSDLNCSTALDEKLMSGSELGANLKPMVLVRTTRFQGKSKTTLICQHCNKSFPFFSWLKSHMRIHTDDKPYKCSQCDRAFTESSALNKHKRIHTGEKPCICPYCNKAFTESSTLNRHKRMHTGEKPFTCLQCNKAFTDSGALHKHKRTHTGKKPFKCSYCNKDFTTPTHLRNHERLHTGIKPFECSFCNKRFVSTSHLKVHIRVHTGEKPFKCVHCNKGFARSDYMRKHLANHKA